MDPNRPAEFRYSKMEKVFWILVGCLAVVLVVVAVNLLRAAPPTSRSAAAMRDDLQLFRWVQMTLVFGATIWLTVFTWLRWKNEKITIDGQTITWTGMSGKVKVSCPLNDLEPGTLKTPSNGSAGYRLQTKRSEIKWLTAIDNCTDLVTLVDGAMNGESAKEAPRLDGIAISDVQTGTYRCRTWALAFIGGFLTLWGCGFSWGALSGLSRLMSGADPGSVVHGASRPAAMATLPIMLAIGLTVLGGGVFSLLLFINGKIEFDGHCATQYHWTGQGKKRYDVSHVKPDDVSKQERSNRGQISYAYSVKTPDGVLKWSDLTVRGNELYASIWLLAQHAHSD